MEKKDYLTKFEAGLDQFISILVWAGKFWGRQGALRWVDLHFWVLQWLGREDDGLSILSSVYYSASGNAFARAQKISFISFVSPFWLLRAVWYLHKAYRFSERFAELVPLKNMTPGQIDIRVQILTAMRQYRLAAEYLDAGLMRPNLSAHDRVLFLIHRAEVSNKASDEDLRRRNPEDLYLEAFHLLEFESVDPSTKVRFYRSCSYRRTGDAARHCLETALQIAHEHNLGDQILKIEAELRKL